MITDFAISRGSGSSDGGGSINNEAPSCGRERNNHQHHTTQYHRVGAGNSFNVNNSSGQCVESGGGFEAVDLSGDSRTEATPGFVAMAATMDTVDTSKVQSLKPLSIRDGGGMRSESSDRSTPGEAVDQLRNLTSQEPHCEDNVRNEWTVLRSPTLAVGDGVASADGPIRACLPDDVVKPLVMNTVISNCNSDQEMSESTRVPIPPCAVSKPESPVFICDDKPLLNNGGVAREACLGPMHRKHDSNAPPFLQD